MESARRRQSKTAKKLAVCASRAQVRSTGTTPILMHKLYCSHGHHHASRSRDCRTSARVPARRSTQCLCRIRRGHGAQCTTSRAQSAVQQWRRPHKKTAKKLAICPHSVCVHVFHQVLYSIRMHRLYGVCAHTYRTPPSMAGAHCETAYIECAAQRRWTVRGVSAHPAPFKNKSLQKQTPIDHVFFATSLAGRRPDGARRAVRERQSPCSNRVLSLLRLFSRLVNTLGFSLMIVFTASFLFS